MRAQGALHVAEQCAGTAVVLVVLTDIFLTVLYARAGSGLVADRLAALIWRSFKRATAGAGRHRDLMLDSGGPAIMVAVIAAWLLGLALGSAMVVHPRLETSVVSGAGPTPTDFVAALYAGGTSTSIVGPGGFVPRTPAFRLLFLLNSLIGMSVLSPLITYLMQAYAAPRGRNAMGLAFHFLSGETGDAAELMARLGPRGRLDLGYSVLASLAHDLGSIEKSHHFYPVLFYFRFRDPRYSARRIIESG